MKKFLFLLLVLIATGGNADATDYTWYFSDDAGGNLSQGSDSNNCSLGSPCRSTSKAQSMINGITNGTDSAHVYFDRGDTWTISSFGTTVAVRRSNVTIDAYGTGAKPIFDGQNIYPSDNGAQTAVFSAGDSSSGATVTNVHFNNLDIRNLSNGVANTDSKSIGVIFYGTSSGNYFTGPGSVRNCVISNVGWSGIGIYRVPNTLGSNYAITIEKNLIECTGWYAKILGGTGPQAINANDGYSCGHIARYNRVRNTHHEGIGARGFALIEYNVFIDNNNPAIYAGFAQGSGSKFSSTIRYNLCFCTDDYTWTGDSNRGGGIWINDEKAIGDNTETVTEIYGNIIFGSRYGLGIKCVPEDAAYSNPIGPVRVYNNTVIDNKQNISVQYPDRFTDVKLYNNASIINSDAESHVWGAQTGSWHISCFHDDLGWSVWDIGPNFYYGDGWNENADMEINGGSAINALWKDTDNFFGTAAPLPKTSGWMSVDDVSSPPTFANMYPASDSELVDNVKVATLSSAYADLLTYGSNWSGLPENPTFVRTNQSDNGDDWEFGAIIYYDEGSVEPPEEDPVEFTDIVIITDPDGTPAVTENPTATWVDNTTRYIGFKLSRDVAAVLNPEAPYVPLTVGARTEYAYFYNIIDIGGTPYMVMEYTPVAIPGDFQADLSFAGVDGFDCHSATFLDSDSNNLCDNKTLPRIDLGGTGAITIAVPYPPRRVKLGTYFVKYLSGTRVKIGE